MAKRGRLVANNVSLQPHELATVEFLLSSGLDIELLVPSLTPHNRSADFVMGGLVWEAKSPITQKKQTIKRLLKEASPQSQNIVIDLRRARIKDGIAIPILNREFMLRKNIKRLIIISHRWERLTLSK